MRTIIAGSRGITDSKVVEDAVISSGFSPTEVLCGTARGVDLLGKVLANQMGIPVKDYPADWDVDGRGAGYKRNIVMADNADALIAVWDGKSRGTKHMIDTANKKGLKVYVHILVEEIPSE